MKNREIKFRAWDETTKTMVEFGLRDVQRNSFSIRELASRNDWGNPIMQFTGLKDKNGKEIYEGDIVKTVSCCCGNKYCRTFTEEINIVSWKRTTGFSPFCDEEESDNHKSNNNKEVIGNVFENPSLLK